MSLLVPAVSAPVDPLDLVRRKLGAEVKSSRLVGRDAFCITYDIVLEDGRMVTLRLANSPSLASVVETETATLKYVAEKTTIPVPNVLQYGPVDEDKLPPSPYFIFEKPAGVPADTVFNTMEPPEQDAFVAQVARLMVELAAHRFASIGSLSLPVSPSPDYTPPTTSYAIRPLVRRPFLADGRAPLALDRGPFQSARAYYRACAQRELASARTLDVDSEGAALPSPAYRQSLEASRRLVERCAALLDELVERCAGLDESDLEGEDAGDGDGISVTDSEGDSGTHRGRFSLDMHDIGLKNILVDPNDHSKIVCITDWQFVNTRPLWCCARTPAWLRPSLSASEDGHAHEAGKTRLAAVFRTAAASVAGVGAAAFVRALDSEDDGAGGGAARCTLDDLADYDAFRDGFLLLPALENILATLPGQEDVAGLKALLDPTTLSGRVARINLLTRGSNAMFLAMTPPRPSTALPADADIDSITTAYMGPLLNVDGTVLVHATG